MEKKPNVFPKPETTTSSLPLSEEQRISQFEAEKKQVTNYIYEQAKTPPPLQNEAPENYNVGGHTNAVEMMKMRTQQQLSQIEQAGIVQEPRLAEKQTTRVVTQNSTTNPSQNKNEELMKLRDEQMRINEENILRYQQQANQASARNNQNPETQNGLYTPNETYNMNENVQGAPNNYNNNYAPPTPPSQPPVNNTMDYGQNPSNINPYILELSQPNYNAPFDVIPLPSKGKLYRNKKANIKLAYMTTADENILTSPNLLESGEFLEIIINRKMLEPDLRYKDLTVGDRNAIMIWLRATAYGEMYPVTLLDENNEPFETEINLNELKNIELGAEPNEEGYFDFKLPLTKLDVKFRMLAVGDIDMLEEMVEKDKNNNLPVNNASTYRMERQLVEVNGSRDRAYIRDFANSMRIADAKALNDYIEKIESGIDLNIEVTTPGGGSIATFLPLNVSFFWPNFRL
jgi:hypothetical protein